MIAADTSTWVVYLQGDVPPDTQLLDQGLANRQVLMVPVVLTELLSDPKLPSSVAKTLSDLPAVPIKAEYWNRAGFLRARVLAKHRKVRLGDAPIAQGCVDHGVSLITREQDFQAFAGVAGLKLAP